MAFSTMHYIYNGARYFLTFIDDFTRKIWVSLIKSKVRIFEKFIKFKALVENQTGKKIQIFKTNNRKKMFN